MLYMYGYHNESKLKNNYSTLILLMTLLSNWSGFKFLMNLKRKFKLKSNFQFCWAKPSGLPDEISTAKLINLYTLNERNVDVTQLFLFTCEVTGKNTGGQENAREARPPDSLQWGTCEQWGNLINSVCRCTRDLWTESVSVCRAKIGLVLFPIKCLSSLKFLKMKVCRS